MDMISFLKQNFSDCTYGGEDENYVMYDVNFIDTYAHINIDKNVKNRTIIKIYDPQSDDAPIEEMEFRSDKMAIQYLKSK